MTDDEYEDDEDGVEPESLGTFGRVERKALAVLDKKPIPFELVGYEYRTSANPEDPDDASYHAEKVFTFHVRPDVEFGPLFGVFLRADSRGRIDEKAAAQFIGDCVVGEEREDFFQTIVRSPDYHFDAQLLVELAEALAERYGMVPTQSRSARRSRPRRHGRTTAAEHSGRVSTSKR